MELKDLHVHAPIVEPGMPNVSWSFRKGGQNALTVRETEGGRRWRRSRAWHPDAHCRRLSARSESGALN
jgi:hypothetical protein